MRNRLKSTLLLVVAFFTHSYAQIAPKPVMVIVEGGTFEMGDNSNNTPIDEKPVHNVMVSSFSMAIYPTTVAEYRAFCVATNHLMPNPPSWGWNDNSPIVNVSYKDAFAYCKWISKLYKNTYRLPTEAEWEYAARGGNKSKGYIYSGGNDPDSVCWYGNNSGAQTHSVGGKKPNELGLYDMSGNVWEWCLDWYDSKYDKFNNLNPEGPIWGTYHVLRGGAWSDAAIYCRVARRNGNPPGYHDDTDGFRVVCIQ